MVHRVFLLPLSTLSHTTSTLCGGRGGRRQRLRHRAPSPRLTLAFSDLPTKPSETEAFYINVGKWLSHSCSWHKYHVDQSLDRSTSNIDNNSAKTLFAFGATMFSHTLALHKSPSLTFCGMDTGSPSEMSAFFLTLCLALVWVKPFHQNAHIEPGIIFVLLQK